MELRKDKEQRENRQLIKSSHLLELVNIFSWLDEEHQERACGALNCILEDQMTEYTATKRHYK